MCGDCSVLGGLGIRENASKWLFPWAGTTLVLCLFLCSEVVFHLYRMHEWKKGVSGTVNGFKIS